MRTKQAFRLEHLNLKDKHKKVFAGPYSFSDNTDLEVEDWADESTEGHTDKNHPEPLLDKKLAPQLAAFTKQKRKPWDETLFFGFKSLKQLKKWFSPKELNRLHDEGFIIAVYNVSLRLDSPYQVAFIPEKKLPRKIPFAM